MADYISLAGLEHLGRIHYTRIEAGSEKFHRKRMQSEGREVYVSPAEVSFDVETTGIPGIACSWWHHLYPNQKLNGMRGRGIKPQRDEMILWGDQCIIHMSPKDTNPQSAEGLEVSVARVD